MTEAEERDAFYQAIMDNWDDDTPRLVYADWLDERGDVELSRLRAALIRGQCGGSSRIVGRVRLALGTSKSRIEHTYPKRGPAEWLLIGAKRYLEGKSEAWLSLGPIELFHLRRE